MRFTSYIYIMLFISIAMYLSGYPSIILYLYAQQGADVMDPVSFANDIATFFIDQPAAAGLLSLSLIVAVGLTRLTTGGFSAIYLLPLIMLLLTLNYIVFPLSFLVDEAMPVEIRIIMAVIFNTMTLLAVLNFTRGGT